MKKKNTIWRALVWNPFVVIIYGVVCYYLYFLAQYGGVSRRAPIILVGALILAGWLIGCLIKYRSSVKKGSVPFGKIVSPALKNISKWWVRFAAVLLVLITLVTGFNIYQSATNFQGKLAFIIDDWVNTRTVEFSHNNLYENGLDGLLGDIQREVSLPNELYVSDEVEITFDQTGQITDVYAFLYGLNKNNETESFLIDYDNSKSKDLTIYLNGFADPNFEEEQQLQPLINALKVLPIQETISDWNEESFGIYYAGYRSWGYNLEGITYFNEKGDTNILNRAEGEIAGYTVSVYTPDNEANIPVRFIDPSIAAPALSAEEQFQIADQETYTPDDEFFYFNEQFGYQLAVVDSAASSRFYVLQQTLDGGETWEVFNSDPFLGSIGVSTGITFINEQIGFIGLSHSGSTYADLYRTMDGGVTFEQVTLPLVEVPLTDEEKYAAFDFPEMPYEENGTLYLLVNQGQDGDYNGNNKLLLLSVDNGETWEFAEEVW
ncbi:WD40/YVTN/BNR-like repeat-containing protein [Desemzia sp. FAM 23989]|uniref:WD40/YVTN/BNR-like repeat-containing protein n=1 Tax=Desemzia sp. FAM 23989 TaxID=3259523 RepID=UPI00388B4D07